MCLLSPVSPSSGVRSLACRHAASVSSVSLFRSADAWARGFGVDGLLRLLVPPSAPLRRGCAVARGGVHPWEGGFIVCGRVAIGTAAVGGGRLDCFLPLYAALHEGVSVPFPLRLGGSELGQLVSESLGGCGGGRFASGLWPGGALLSACFFPLPFPPLALVCCGVCGCCCLRGCVEGLPRRRRVEGEALLGLPLRCLWWRLWSVSSSQGRGV